jgi:hypothetical protein
MDQTPGDRNDPIEQPRGRHCQARATFFRARLDASDVVPDAFLDVARDRDASRLCHRDRTGSS